MNPVPIIKCYFFIIHCNNILQSKFMSPKLSLSFRIACSIRMHFSYACLIEGIIHLQHSQTWISYEYEYLTEWKTSYEGRKKMNTVKMASSGTRSTKLPYCSCFFCVSYGTTPTVITLSILLITNTKLKDNDNNA
jgi:hypothetical protein